MERYNEYLDIAQLAVFRAARVPTRLWSEQVSAIDESMLKTEAQRLMTTKGVDWEFLDNVEAAPIPLWKWWWYRIPGMAKRGFIRRLRKYGIDV